MAVIKTLKVFLFLGYWLFIDQYVALPNFLIIIIIIIITSETSQGPPPFCGN